MAKYFWVYFPLFLLLIHSPSLANFFAGDDWFHLRISNIHSVGDFLNFFSFSPTPQSATFFRPLPTQAFFFFFQKVFSLNSLPYHFFVLLCFVFSVYLVYKLSQIIFKDNNKSLITALVYGVSSSNFTRVYFLSAFQEISLVIFGVLFLISHIKNKPFSFLFFVLALCSKETAVVLPFLALVYDLINRKVKLPSYLICFLLLAPYLYLRFIVFGMAEGDSYVWNLSPIKALNTLTWYGLWSFGAPEFLVDYIGSGFKPIPKLFIDFKNTWSIIIIPLVVLLASLLIPVFKLVHKLDKLFLFSILFFIITLLPVLFLPEHKFALELGLPLIGFSLAVSHLLSKNKLSYLWLSLFILYNLFSNFQTYQTSYSVSRSQVSKNIYDYFERNHPNHPLDKSFYFNNSDISQTVWGESKQIALSLSSSDFFKVYYQTDSLRVYYEDIDTQLPPDFKIIKISSDQFLTRK